MCSILSVQEEHHEEPTKSGNGLRSVCHLACACGRRPARARPGRWRLRAGDRRLGRPHGHAVSLRDSHPDRANHREPGRSPGRGRAVHVYGHAKGRSLRNSAKSPSYRTVAKEVPYTYTVRVPVTTPENADHHRVSAPWPRKCPTPTGLACRDHAGERTITEYRRVARGSAFHLQRPVPVTTPEKRGPSPSYRYAAKEVPYTYRSPSR